MACWLHAKKAIHGLLASRKKAIHGLFCWVGRGFLPLASRKKSHPWPAGFTQKKPSMAFFCWVGRGFLPLSSRKKAIHGLLASRKKAIHGLFLLGWARLPARGFAAQSRQSIPSEPEDRPGRRNRLSFRKPHSLRSRHRA